MTGPGPAPQQPGTPAPTFHGDLGHGLNHPQRGDGHTGVVGGTHDIAELQHVSANGHLVFLGELLGPHHPLHVGHGGAHRDARQVHAAARHHLLASGRDGETRSHTAHCGRRREALTGRAGDAGGWKGRGPSSRKPPLVRANPISEIGGPESLGPGSPPPTPHFQARSGTYTQRLSGTRENSAPKLPVYSLGNGGPEESPCPGSNRDSAQRPGLLKATFWVTFQCLPLPASDPSPTPHPGSPEGRAGHW